MARALNGTREEAEAACVRVTAPSFCFDCSTQDVESFSSIACR